MKPEPRKGLELRSKITSGGELELTLAEAIVPEPSGDQVVVRVEAAPINPSDLAVLLGPADVASVRADGERAVAPVPPEGLRAVHARLDQAMATGIEGAGTIVDAGPEARGLVGKRVALAGGGLYAQWKLARARDCLVFPEGTAAAQAASAYVNPMTALAMVETMRHEGHTAIVHTAAASNLGQMLVKICAGDRVPLVNIVRSAEHVALLRGLGATHVLDSTAPSFRADLTEAIAASTSRCTCTACSTSGPSSSPCRASGSPGASAASCSPTSSRRPAPRSHSGCARACSPSSRRRSRVTTRGRSRSARRWIRT
jgi:NADPH2:quinone reductase